MKKVLPDAVQMSWHCQQLNIARVTTIPKLRAARGVPPCPPLPAWGGPVAAGAAAGCAVGRPEIASNHYSTRFNVRSGGFLMYIEKKKGYFVQDFVSEAIKVPLKTNLNQRLSVSLSLSRCESKRCPVYLGRYLTVRLQLRSETDRGGRGDHQPRATKYGSVERWHEHHRCCHGP